ncbi:MAG: peptidase S41 [Winogradskyella sp.]|nr:peptidase S41 [Winogradskyella sp.]
MKNVIRVLILSNSLIVFTQNFSKQDVISDLDYLRSSLERTHFDLYHHIAKEDFVKKYNEVRMEIAEDSLSYFEVAMLFQRLVASVNNGHTRIEFYDQVQSYVAHMDKNGTVFPLELAIEDNRVYVRRNWSDNRGIKIGSEIKSINGIPIKEVLDRIYPYVSAERKYFRNALIESFTFPRYYWRVFGEKNAFDVEISEQNSLKRIKIKAIEANTYESKWKSIIKNNRVLEFLSASVAYLRPGSFGGDLDKYKKFIDSSFTEINKQNYSDLVIDLRNHSGGDDIYGDYLVSYFADKPFQWNSKFQLKTSSLLKENVIKTKDTTNVYWQAFLNHKNGEIFNYNFSPFEPQEKSKRFKGKVYVLVNRHSYSQSTVTAALIKDYNFGTIVGEETAEYPTLLASIFTYKLPFTGIKVDVPKGKIYRINGEESRNGLIPQIIIRDHLLDEKDEIVEGLLKRLKR